MLQGNMKQQILYIIFLNQYLKMKMIQRNFLKNIYNRNIYINRRNGWLRCKMYNKDKILRKVDILYNQWKEGSLGGEVIPEDTYSH